MGVEVYPPIDNVSLVNTPAVLYATEFGAIGNGVADDTAAIQAAIDAAHGSGGGVVKFPRGDYCISEPVYLRSLVALSGTHSPRYAPDENPTSSCKIRALPTFAGAGVIIHEENVNGARVDGICFVGPGEAYGSVVHGFLLPQVPTYEMGFVVSNTTVAGFSGDGFNGRMFVGDLSLVHVTRCRTGITATDGSFWRDCRIHQSQFYFNKDAGIVFAGTAYSGAITISSSRIERSGNTYGEPLSPRNTDAPGIRIETGFNIQIIGCSTDANTGDGILLERTSSARLDTVQIIGCQFARDGGGDQLVQADRAGVRVKGTVTNRANYIEIIGCAVTYGKHDDGGSGTVLSPKYGIQLEESFYANILANRVDTDGGDATAYSFVGANVYRPQLIDPERGIMTLPKRSNSTGVPTLSNGQTMWADSLARPLWWNGSAWKDAVGLAGIDFADGAFTADVRVSKAAGTSRCLQLETSGVERWWVAATSAAETGSNVGSNFAISRWDDDGAFLANALEIRRDNGTVTIPGRIYSTGGIERGSFAAQTLAAAGAVTVTVGPARVHRVVLNDNCTGLTISAGAFSGDEMVLIVKQGTGGSKTVASWTNVAWSSGNTPPTLSTVAGYQDVFSFLWDGSRWLEMSRSMAVYV